MSTDASDAIKWKRDFISTNKTRRFTLRNAMTRVARQLLAMASDFSGFHFFHDDPFVPKPFDGTPLIDRLSNVTPPVLVIVGEHDTHDFTKNAQRVWQSVPNRAQVCDSVITGPRAPTSNLRRDQRR